jgi:hypothetical protein
LKSSNKKRCSLIQNIHIHILFEIFREWEGHLWIESIQICLNFCLNKSQAGLFILGQPKPPAQQQPPWPMHHLSPVPASPFPYSRTVCADAACLRPPASCHCRLPPHRAPCRTIVPNSPLSLSLPRHIGPPPPFSLSLLAVEITELSPPSLSLLPKRFHVARVPPPPPHHPQRLFCPAPVVRDRATTSNLEPPPSTQSLGDLSPPFVHPSSFSGPHLPRPLARLQDLTGDSSTARTPPHDLFFAALPWTALLSEPPLPRSCPAHSPGSPRPRSVTAAVPHWSVCRRGCSASVKDEVVLGRANTRGLGAKTTHTLFIVLFNFQIHF